MIQLTRRYRFPAAHVLRQPSLSDAENERIYGKCAHPSGHGHDYGVEVTVTGPVDAATGSIVSPALLDEIVGEHVLAPFSHSLLNQLDPFRDLVPTAENIARVLYQTIAPALARRTGARLVRIGVVETRRNRFEYGDAS